MEITRATFERLIESILDRAAKPCEIALKDAGLDPSEVHEVVLVGGSTRVPAVQELVERVFQKKPNRSVNPDEVVALGAAIQGGILQGDENLKDVLLLDVTPLSLGIETLGGVMTKLIERTTTIPTTKKEVFSTAADNQPAVDIKVFQGEREMATDNRLLGSFVLDGIPPARRGVPQIEVSFDIDANGILNVSAKDLGSGKEQKIRIESSSGISKDEIEAMRKDAETHAEEDEKKRETVDLRNSADHLAHETEKFLEDNADKVDDGDKARLQAAVDQLKSAKDSEDATSIKGNLEEVQKIFAEVGTKLHEAGAAGATGAGAGGAGAAGGDPGAAGAGAGEGADAGAKKDDETIIDADYEVKE